METTNHNLIKLGKFRSLVLRHKPEVIDIHPDLQGWVDIDTLLAQCLAHDKPIDRPTLDAIVATNNKQRYLQQAGHQFFCTPNGVWLTEHVPIKYLARY